VLLWYSVGTMSGKELLKKRRNDILKVAKEHGASNVRVFGSVVRGEDVEGSDIDFLVEMEKGRSYFDLVGFWQVLEDMLGRKIDVLTDGGLSPYIRDRILGEAVPL
jgi:uncharacterized protein